MRKLILFMHVSVDDFIAASDNKSAWTSHLGIFEHVVPDLINESDTLLLGRGVADEFLDYWLNAEARDPSLSKGEIAYARWATSTHKVVLAGSKIAIEGQNTQLYVVNNDEETIKAVDKLKKQPGKNIVSHGGVRLSQSLVRLGLVDEYQFVIHPIVLGKGKALFQDITSNIEFKLIMMEKLKDNGIFVRYSPINKT
jgi:dihydrofolate reductase